MPNLIIRIIRPAIAELHYRLTTLAIALAIDNHVAIYLHINDINIQLAFARVEKDMQNYIDVYMEEALDRGDDVKTMLISRLKSSE